MSLIMHFKWLTNITWTSKINMGLSNSVAQARIIFYYFH